MSDNHPTDKQTQGANYSAFEIGWIFTAGLIIGFGLGYFL